MAEQESPLRLVQLIEPDDAGGVVEMILGASGAQVSTLQEHLKTWGFDPGEYGGEYGQRTQDAVASLQRDLGLEPTGQFDDATQQRVTEDLNSDASKLRQTALVPLDANGQPQTDAPPVASEGLSVGKILAGMLGFAGVLWLLSRKGGKATLVISPESFAGVDRVVIDEGLEDMEDEEESKPKKKRKKRKPRKKKALGDAAVAADVAAAADTIIEAELVKDEPEPEPEDLSDAPVKPKRKRKRKAKIAVEDQEEDIEDAEVVED